jgi:hypothetical protein
MSWGIRSDLGLLPQLVYLTLCRSMKLLAQLAAAMPPRRRCCICLVRGMLRPRRGLASDRHGQLVKCDCHPPGHRFLKGQLVMPSADVLYEGVPGDYDPGAAVLLEPAHRTKSCLQAAMVGLDPVVGVLLCVVPRRRQQLLQDRRVGRRLIGHDLARDGLDRVDDPLENRRAARRSRAGETNTSMACPN